MAKFTVGERVKVVIPWPKYGIKVGTECTILAGPKIRSIGRTRNWYKVDIIEPGGLCLWGQEPCFEKLLPSSEPYPEFSKTVPWADCPWRPHHVRS